jgi:hypothetical protein
VVGCCSAQPVLTVVYVSCPCDYGRLTGVFTVACTFDVWYCNASYKPKNCIQTLALETETAVNFLPILEQDHIRWQIAKTINKLYKCNLKQTNSHNAAEGRIKRRIKEKNRNKQSKNNEIR